MSFLVKGVEIPRSCWECEWYNGRFNECAITRGRAQGDKRPDDCPLKETTLDGDLISRQAVLDAINDCGICIQKILDLPSALPPHGRLIDADAFEKFILEKWEEYDHWFANEISERPTIIEAEDGET